MTRLITALALALALLAGIAAAAPAKSNAAVLVGIGDQNPSTFSHPLFKAAQMKRTRGFFPWDLALKPADRARFDQWLAAVRANRIQPLVSFNPSTGSQCPARPCRLPSVRAFRKAFRAFRKRYPSVRIISPWNEANHRSQPTWKKPKRAAQYYNVVRKLCRGCTIVAADVIDETNMVKWLRKFRKTAKKPRIWGLHNYRDVNPRPGQKYGGTRRLLRATPRRSKVWMTETGGIVQFILPSGGTLFPYSEQRANRAVSKMFRLAKRFRRRVKRLYMYHWQQSCHDNRFDAGIIACDGRVRPVYSTVRARLRLRLFRP